MNKSIFQFVYSSYKGAPGIELTGAVKIKPCFEGLRWTPSQSSGKIDVGDKMCW